jgi:competence protein ComEC
VSRRLVSTAAGWWAVAVCAGLAASAALASALHLPLGLALLPAFGSLALTAAAHVRPRAALLALVLAATAAGLTRGAIDSSHSVLDSALRSGTVVLSGTVREGTGARRSTAQVIVDVDRAQSGDGALDVHGGVLATLRTAPRVLPGDRVELDATGLRPPRTTGAESALPRDGVVAVAQSATMTVVSDGGVSLPRLLAKARLGLASSVDSALPEPASSLVNALAFAIPRTLPADLTAALRDSGLAHMVATSGLKVAIIAGLVGAMLGGLATPPRLRMMLMALAVGTYILLCGASPAAVRSALMAATGWALYGTGRSADPLPLLAAVAAAMVLVAPGLAQDVGFQLSFLGTLGILLLAAPIAERLRGPRLLREPFAVTLAASAVTVPVMASTFGVVSFVGPVANALAVPLLTPLLVCGGLGAALAWVAPALGFVPLQVAGAAAGAIATIARWCASLPFAAVHVQGWAPAFTVAEVAAVIVAFATWRVARRRVTAPLLPRLFGSGATATSAGSSRQATTPRLPRRRVSRPAAALVAALAACLTGTAVVLAANRPDGRLHVAVLDVGAARATLIQTATGDRALVDAGPDPQHLLDALGPALPPLTREIGMLVLTAGDRGGAGGLPGLDARYHVDLAVALDGLAAATRTGLSALADHGTEVRTVAADSSWTWGGATWRLLPAQGAQPAAALHVIDPSGSVLLAGNLAAAAQEELAGLDAAALRADLLVAPPGGALAPGLVAAVRPSSIAVPSAHGGRTPPTTLVAGTGVRRTGDAGTLTYAGGDGGLTPT